VKRGIRAPRKRLARIQNLTSIFLFPFSIFLLSVLPSGCASPGEPLERKAAVPAAITDLSAEQSGNSAILTFTLPRETVERRSLKRAPDVEIYRDFSNVNASPPSATSASSSTPAAPSASPSNPSLLVTIPSALVSHYEQGGQIRYPDAWTPDVLKQRAGETATYIVRTSESRKKPSPDSNPASVRVDPAPVPISDLKAELVRSGLHLSWSAPSETPAGPAPPIKEYQIYRAELSPGSASEQPAAAQPQVFPIPGAKRAAPRQEKIGNSESPSYEDSQVAVGATYEYFVRSVVEYSGEPVESGDSNSATITVRSIFPPSAPTGLVVVPVPAEGGIPAHLDLSWAVNPETEVAGYNVYRSEQEDTRGNRLNAQLLPTPAFSDMSTIVGQHYFYRITAVDRFGNESEPGATVSGEIPAESQPKP
jgi:hypothetical protein